MTLNQLNTRFLHWAWKLLNNIRHPYPRPRRAVLFTDAVSEEGVDVLWEGAPPETQTLAHSLKPLNVGTLAFFAPFVLCLHHGSVRGKRGDVITAKGTIFTNISPEIPRRPEHHFLLERGNMPKPKYMAGSVAVLNCGPYRNYFHFMFDAISRLYFFQQAGVKADYYCVAQNAPFQQELLRLFGIHEHQIIPLEKGTHLVAQDLLVSSLPGYNQISAQVHLKDYSTYHFVRQSVLSQLPKDPGDYASHVYIQRWNKRTLANEVEVLSELSLYGKWKVVRLEEHTVLEQAAIFYHAQAVVAVHGAGLANLVYAQAGTQVVELFNPTLIEPIYFQLANLLQLRYHPVVGKPADATPPATDQADSVWVDPKKIRQCLE